MIKYLTLILALPVSTFAAGGLISGGSSGLTTNAVRAIMVADGVITNHSFGVVLGNGSKTPGGGYFIDVFTGQFKGDGSLLTNISASALPALPYVAITNGYTIGLTNYGSVGRTNWYQQTASGFLMTNVNETSVSMANGNVTASGYSTTLGTNFSVNAQGNGQIGGVGLTNSVVSVGSSSFSMSGSSSAQLKSANNVLLYPAGSSSVGYNFSQTALSPLSNPTASITGWSNSVFSGTLTVTNATGTNVLGGINIIGGARIENSTLSASNGVDRPFGQMIGADITNAIAVSNTYYAITNISDITAYGGICSVVNGTNCAITNLLAGWRKVSLGATFYSIATPPSGDEIHISCFTNGVEFPKVEIIGTGQLDNELGFKSCFVLLPAGCRLDIRVKNVDDTDSVVLKDIRLLLE